MPQEKESDPYHAFSALPYIFSISQYVFQFHKDVDSINSEQLWWCKGNYGRISIHIMSFDWEFEFEGRSVIQLMNVLFPSQFNLSICSSWLSWILSCVDEGSTSLVGKK